MNHNICNIISNLINVHYNHILLVCQLFFVEIYEIIVRDWKLLLKMMGKGKKRTHGLEVSHVFLLKSEKKGFLNLIFYIENVFLKHPDCFLHILFFQSFNGSSVKIAIGFFIFVPCIVKVLGNILAGFHQSPFNGFT